MLLVMVIRLFCAFRPFGAAYSVDKHSCLSVCLYVSLSQTWWVVLRP
jgi:hypothetical protein